MKIVNRKEFLAMPSGTLFQKIDQHGNMDRLSIKFDTWTNDFLCEDVAPIDAFNDSYFLDNPSQKDYEAGVVWRDGLYDEDQKFVVWQDVDVRNMLDYVEARVLEKPTP